MGTFGNLILPIGNEVFHSYLGLQLFAQENVEQLYLHAIRAYFAYLHMHTNEIMMNEGITHKSGSDFKLQDFAGIMVSFAQKCAALQTADTQSP